MSKTQKSKNPAHIGASPSEPGGMSQKALKQELDDRGVAYNSRISWPDLIKAVADSRLQVEREAEAAGEELMFIRDPHSYDFRFDGHAGAGPSGAERWMNCTASLEATRAFLETLSPNQKTEFAKSSTAARQGTTAHSVAEIRLSELLGVIDSAEADSAIMDLTLSPESEEEAYSDEMEAFVSEYVDFVQQYHLDGREILVEARVSAVVELTDGTLHEIKGSVDCGILPTEAEKALVVADLKFGNGIDVEVEANPQVRIYALGLLGELVDDEGHLPDLDRIEYVIAQPRLGGIKTWSESVEALLDWRDDVLAPALTLALRGTEGGATYNPSDVACQWCPARGGCEALAERTVENAAELFDTIVEAEFDGGTGAFPETGLLSDERIGTLLAQINGLEKVGKDLRAEVQRRLHRGTKVPGWKMVSYTPPRRWKDHAESALEELEGLWSRKLLSPTQAVKLLEKTGDEKALNGLIDAPAKRPVAAPEGDRRKEWTGVPPEMMFNDESTNETGE